MTKTTAGTLLRGIFFQRSAFNRPSKEMTVEFICFLLILLFVYAAVSKIIDYQKFRVELNKSPLLFGFGNWVAWLIPGSEICISIMLSTKQFREKGLYASFNLMVMFTAYIYTILHFTYHIPCSCGGVLEKLSWSQHLAFNAIFIILAALGVLLNPTSSKIKPIKVNRI